MNKLRIRFSKAGDRDFAALDPPVKKKVMAALERASEGHGDVKKLQGSDELRLRAGDWRILFEILPDEREPAANVLQVLRIRHRSKAYRDL